MYMLIDYVSAAIRPPEADAMVGSTTMPINRECPYAFSRAAPVAHTPLAIGESTAPPVHTPAHNTNGAHASAYHAAFRVEGSVQAPGIIDREPGSSDETFRLKDAVPDSAREPSPPPLLPRGPDLKLAPVDVQDPSPPLLPRHDIPAESNATPHPPPTPPHTAPPLIRTPHVGPPEAPTVPPRSIMAAGGGDLTMVAPEGETLDEYESPDEYEIPVLYSDTRTRTTPAADSHGRNSPAGKGMDDRWQDPSDNALAAPLPSQPLAGETVSRDALGGLEEQERAADRVVRWLDTVAEGQEHDEHPPPQPLQGANAPPPTAALPSHALPQSRTNHNTSKAPIEPPPPANKQTRSQSPQHECHEPTQSSAPQSTKAPRRHTISDANPFATSHDDASARSRDHTPAPRHQGIGRQNSRAFRKRGVPPPALPSHATTTTQHASPPTARLARPRLATIATAEAPRMRGAMDGARAGEAESGGSPQNHHAPRSRGMSVLGVEDIKRITPIDDEHISVVKENKFGRHKSVRWFQDTERSRGVGHDQVDARHQGN